MSPLKRSAPFLRDSGAIVCFPQKNVLTSALGLWHTLTTGAMMTDDQLQLNAQRSLQEFDDARGSSTSNLYDLGQKAIDVLDSFISNWSDKPYMQHMNVDLSEGGHDALKRS